MDTKRWRSGMAHTIQMCVSFLIAVLFAVPAAAQDGGDVKRDAPRSTLEQQGEGRLFLDVGDRLVLPAWREYDYLAQERSDSIVAASRLRVDAASVMTEAELRSSTTDERLAAFHMQLSMGGGDGMSFAESVARFLLAQALQFGYQYARERVRAASLSDMDYLYLPQGPGVTRTFFEVGNEARLRGEMQSQRVWRDYYEWKKNRVGKDD